MATQRAMDDQFEELEGLRAELAEARDQIRALHEQRAADAARDSRYRTVFMTMTEGFALHEILTDREGHPCDYRFLEVNPAFERMTGLNGADVVGRRVLEVLPETEPIWIERYGRVALTGESDHFEHFSSALGRWFEVLAYRTDTRQFAVIFSDVSDRKRADAALRASEEHLRLLFDQAPDGILLSEAEGRFVDVNAAACEMLGYPREELLQLSISDIVALEERPRVSPEAARVNAGAVLRNEWRLLRKDGAELIGDVLASRLPNGRVQAFVRDVTEKRRAEAELQHSRLDLDRAQSVGQIGSWRLDVRRNCLTWSDQNHRIFGVPKGLPLTYQTFLAIVHPEDRDYVNERWEAALRGEPYDIEHRLLVRDEVKWVRERAFLEFDESGKLLGGFGITHDITERKHAEATIKSFALFAQENPSPVLRIDPGGVVLMANRAAGPELEALGSGVGAPAPKAWTSWVRTSLSKGLRRSVKVKLGRRTFSFHIVPIVEQGYANLYGRDISVQERTLDALRDARADLAARVAARTRDLSATTELLERMFDDTHLLMAHLDRDFHYLRVNRAFAKVAGRRAIDLLGDTHFALFPSETHEATFRRVVSTGRTHSGLGDSFLVAGGIDKPSSSWDWTVQPVRGPEGEVAGVLLSLLDVTARVRLEQEIVRIEERERRATSAELHDTVGQELTAVGYMLDNLEIELVERNVPVGERFKVLRSAVSTADNHVRSISRGLQPSQSASGGLPGALADLAHRVESRFPIRCSCECPSVLELEDVTATQVLRIAQEAVNNAVKHAAPTNVRIQVVQTPSLVTLTVRDNGVGVPDDVSDCAGLGLHIMIHRAATVGGSLHIRPDDRGGTVVSCSVPAGNGSGVSSSGA